MARADSMATIDLALSQTKLSPAAGSNSSTPAVAPQIAPGVPAPAPLTDKLTGKAEQGEKIFPEETPEIPEVDDAQVEERNTSVFMTAAGSTVNAAKDIWRGTRIKLERLPAPGSILLPLIVLLLFFFLLIPVNGNTRLAWLWLVLTGNAEIGQEAETATPIKSEKGGQTADTTPAPANGNQVNVIPFAFPIMTGAAEDF